MMNQSLDSPTPSDNNEHVTSPAGLRSTSELATSLLSSAAQGFCSLGQRRDSYGWFSLLLTQTGSFPLASSLPRIPKPLPALTSEPLWGSLEEIGFSLWPPPHHTEVLCWGCRCPLAHPLYDFQSLVGLSLPGPSFILFHGNFFSLSFLFFWGGGRVSQVTQVSLEWKLAILSSQFSSV